LIYNFPLTLILSPRGEEGREILFLNPRGRHREILSFKERKKVIL